MMATRVGVSTVPKVGDRKCDRCGQPIRTRRANVTGIYLCRDCRPYRRDYERK